MLNIKDTIVGEKYVPNHVFLNILYNMIRSSNPKKIQGALSCDHVSFVPKSPQNENGEFSNMMTVTEGELAGTKMPITHCCAFVFTPFTNKVPKMVLFM